MTSIWKHYPHISRRFPDTALLEAFTIFDPSIIPQNLGQQASHGAEKLQVLINHYGPHGVIDPEAVKSELQIFNSVVAANVDMKQFSTRRLMSHLLATSEVACMFPSLSQLASIGLLLPMSTVDCERGFSALSRVKTDLRNRLCSKTLNNLLMISIEGPAAESFPYEKACDIWASWRSRRINVTV